MEKKQSTDTSKSKKPPEVGDDLLEPETEVNSKKSFPLDHGWAWFILIGSVLVMGIFIGVMKASGILFVTFQQQFNATASVTSLISTVQNAASSLSALFVMTIGVKLTSCRVIVFLGGILISASYIITAMANNILWLLISYGVLLGIGSACVVPTTMSILGHYFDKRRGLANSVAVSGGSLGGLMFAPLITKLLEHFGYRGCMLILAAVHLHLCISAVLFRPVSFYKPTADNLPKLSKKEIKQRKRLSSDIDERLRSSSDVRKSLLLKNMLIHDLSIPNVSVESEVRKPRSESASVIVPVGKRTVEVESLLLGSVPCIPQAVELSPFKRPRTFTESSVQRITKPFSHLHQERNKIHDRSSSEYLSGSHMDVTGFIQCPDSSNNRLDEVSTNEQEPRTNCLKTCKGFFDFTLLFDPVFMFMLFAFGLICSGNLMCMVYVAPHATDLGLRPNDIATLITIYSAIDFFARIVLGVIADLHWFRRSTIVGTCAIIVGISCSFLELYTSFALMVMFVSVLGTVSGAYFALQAVVMVDYMSVERLQSVLGFTTLSNGAFVAAGYYGMGSLRDNTGSYIAPYHLIAAMTLTGGALLLILPLIEKWTKRGTKSAKNEEIEKVVENR